jgi:putative RNA 2'-phosphotransferase
MCGELFRLDLISTYGSQVYSSRIKLKGLIRGSRQHVHLSVLVQAALKVGERHGKPVVIPVRAREMYRAGFAFFFTANEVWLVDAVPPEYLKLDGLIFT